MSDAIVGHLAQGGATALLLAIMLLVVLPRFFKLQTDLLQTFSDQLAAERKSRSEDMHKEAQAIESMAVHIEKLADQYGELTHHLDRHSRELGMQSRQLSEQTDAMKEMIRELTQLLRGLPPQPRFGGLRIQTAGPDEDPETGGSRGR